MFAKLPEKFLRLTRWIIVIGWIGLIFSLFYDPFSSNLTAPGQIFAAAADCFQFQGECRPLTPYPMGARLFWGMVLPVVVLTLLILGHEAWRRICPLSFLSQIPRSLGIQRKITIDEESWLGKNALFFQFSLLFVGLNVRLLLVNSDRLLLGVFLLLTVLAALTIGFLFDGKTWCNYFCPMAPVQMVYSEPSGLLGSKAHLAPPKSITQSMCRTIDAEGQEKSACVACKSPCMDIDAEGEYWNGIRRSERKLLYYGYLGLVLGFYLYFWLYTGNWQFLSAGVWNETNQLATLLSPGFFIANQTIPIPKLIAVPLTLTVSTGLGYTIGVFAEIFYKQYNQRQARPLNRETLQSRLFAITAFLAFNALFFMGVRPTLGYFPGLIQNLIAWAAVLLSSLWLVKTWHRSLQRYSRERDTNLLRRQLGKLDVDLSQFLEGRSLADLSADELYTLAKVMPGFTQEYRWQIYRNVLREALEQKSTTPSSSLKAFESLRQKLGIADESHGAVLDQLQLDFPHLFPLPQRQIREHDSTIVRREAPSYSEHDTEHDTTVVRLSTSDNSNPDPDRTVWRTPEQSAPPPAPSDDATAVRSRPDEDPDRTVWRKPADQ
jgi:hypothetical protein